MRTPRARNTGFVLVFVIMIMGLVAVEMFVLADVSNTFLHETNAAYLKTCRDNLNLSGLAWSQSNPGRLSGEDIDLDVSALCIKNGRLSLKVNGDSVDRGRLAISTSCSRGRQILRHRAEYSRD